MARRSSIGGLHRSAGLVSPRSAARSRRGGEAVCKGNPARPPGRQEISGAGGFTLLEMVVVLALFGLISTVLITGSGALLRTVSQDDVENTALSAIASARHGAVLAGRTLELRIDDQARTLDWGDGRAPLTGAGGVRLLPPVKTSAVLIGGQAVEAPLARVRFYADGTCDPFRLEITRDKNTQLLTIDPWTCTVLAPKAPPSGH